MMMDMKMFDAFRGCHPDSRAVTCFAPFSAGRLDTWLVPVGMKDSVVPSHTTVLTGFIVSDHLAVTLTLRDGGQAPVPGARCRRDGFQGIQECCQRAAGRGPRGAAAAALLGRQVGCGSAALVTAWNSVRSACKVVACCGPFHTSLSGSYSGMEHAEAAAPWLYSFTWHTGMWGCCSAALLTAQ